MSVRQIQIWTLIVLSYITTCKFFLHLELLHYLWSYRCMNLYKKHTIIYDEHFLRRYFHNL